MADTFHHVSIMLDTCVEALSPRPGGIFVDGTLGGGGHAEGVLKHLGPDGRLYGIDRDEDALNASSARLAPYGEAFVPIRGNFKDMPQLLRERGITGVDGIMLDLGVSSWQLDSAERGFSYNADAPLDMRMDRRQQLSAYDVVNSYPPEELVRILRQYGEEKFATRIVDFIVKARPIATTGELVEVIRNAIPAKARREGPHPAKRTFQAIRIEVNAELTDLEEALTEMIRMLNPGGHLCVLTFHSLEDRACKRAMRLMEDPCTCPPRAPMCVCGRHSLGKCTPRKPMIPSDEEIAMNPRARSAKLRVFTRNDAPLF